MFPPSAFFFPHIIAVLGTFDWISKLRLIDLTHQDNTQAGA